MIKLQRKIKTRLKYISSEEEKLEEELQCVIFLTQSFFAIPTLIKRQFNYVMILKLSGKRDLNLILSNYALGIEVDQIIDLYKNATKDKFNFLKIDIENRDDNKKFSHNFTHFYEIKNEDSD